MSFVHLRTQTHRSIKEGLMDCETLVEQAQDKGHTMLALTDVQTVSGIIEFQTLAKKAGIKPILGADLYIETDLTDPTNTQPTKLLLLAETTQGYQQLLRLITKANKENVQNEVALVKQSWLQEMGTQGLVALTGDPTFGEIPRAVVQDDPKAASQSVKKLLEVYTKLFPNALFLEVSRDGRPQEQRWVERMAKLSSVTTLPLVATNPVKFANREDFFAHEVHSAITTQQQIFDPNYTSNATREQYYTSTEQMQELFSDIPQALDNAVLLAQRCNAQPTLGINHLPNFALPEGEQDIDAYFAKLANAGLDERLKKLFPDPAERARQEPQYRARLQEEIDVIVNMKFPGYFLVVSDFIRWSKDNGVPVGPGRGSGAGSLVAYSLNITDLDPIKHSLLFERFLNPERVSMPDIDIDFCRDRREETIDYIFQRYGIDAVAQISTVMSLGAKAAVRHVGKVLNYPIPRQNEIANLIPKTIDITIEQALEQEEKLKTVYENDKMVRRWLDMAMKLEGTTLSTGVHAGGVVIAPGRIDDYAPMMRAHGKDVSVTQFDKDDVEKAGLIKFDLLGLKTLTLLDQAKKLIDARPDRQGNPLDLSSIDLNDPSAIELLRQGNTYGVFQLESRGMISLVKSLQPDNFEDVVALLALFRPGPLNSGMVDNFVQRKHGQAEISYYHPKLEAILKPTYGVIVYQEQVMQIAQAVAGYSLGGADLLRRAMGKKKPEEMAKERVKFETGAAANGIDPTLAKELFDVMEKFAEYGFNRSHSAAYAVLSMQTAFLKANYPSEYFAAYMNVEKSNTDVLAQAVSDARQNNLTILPPDINTSNVNFEPLPNKTIRYGLSALKGVSEKTLNDIIACRQDKGEFTSLPDFLNKFYDHLREHGRNAQVKGITETLIKSGAFDSLHPNRALLLAALPDQLAYFGKLARRNAAKSSDAGEVLMPNLWSAVGITPIPAPVKTKRNQKPLEEPAWPDEKDHAPWSDIEQLSQEAKAIGFFLNGHPFDAYIKQLDGLRAAIPLGDISTTDINPYDSVLVAGVIENIKEYTPASGKKMAFVTLSDGASYHDVTIFADTYAQHKDKIKPGAFIGLEANIRASRKKDKENEKDVTAQQVFSVDELETLLSKTWHVAITPQELTTITQLSKELAQTDAKNVPQVNCVLNIAQGDGHYHQAQLSQKWPATQDNLAKLKSAFPGRVVSELVSSITFAPSERKPKNRSNNRRPN